MTTDPADEYAARRIAACHACGPDGLLPPTGRRCDHSESTARAHRGAQNARRALAAGLARVAGRVDHPDTERADQ